MTKIDLLDRKILYELEIDSRQPVTSLAKKLNRNRNVIDYRIRKLQEKGIIKNFVTMLDPGTLGLMIWNVYLEFQNLTPKIEQEIINYLKDKKNVWWIALTTGKWNLIYSLFIKNVREFYFTVRNFNSKYDWYILNQSLAAHVEIDIFSRGYFLDKPSIVKSWFEKFETVKLDKTDKFILKKLSTNARISSVELAKSLNLTPRAVSFRIKNLIKKGVISRFRMQLDVSKIGYNFFKVIVHLKNISKFSDNELREYCRQLGKVFHYEKKIGPWMLELELDEENYAKVHEMMKKMKEVFPDYIKSYEIMLIYKEPKGELDLTQQM